MSHHYGGVLTHVTDEQTFETQGARRDVLDAERRDFGRFSESHTETERRFEDTRQMLRDICFLLEGLPHTHDGEGYCRACDGEALLATAKGYLR